MTATGEYVMTLTPYHPKELGHGSKPKGQLHTGLWGVFVLLCLVMTALLTALVTCLVVLAGVAEVVDDGPLTWRVRWRRRHSEGGVR